MRGKWNNETKKYEEYGVEAVQDKLYGYTTEEIAELRLMEKIKAEGGTFLERYAKELGVTEKDLFTNILKYNSIERFNSVRNYTEFKMLKQTLVPETGPMGTMKEFNNAIRDVIGNTSFKY